MLGWRKLTAWGLVFALTAVATLWQQVEIPANNVSLIQWVTAFFFGANALKPLFQNVSVTAK